jgi:hypothetical protein
MKTMSKRKRRGGKTTAPKVDQPDDLPAKTEPKQQQKTWQEHVKGITAAWQKSVESILETGRLLIAAKDDLPFGSWEAVVKSKLPFSADVANRLMVIAAHPVLSNPGHARDLPAHYETLYALTLMDKKLGEGALITRIKDGTINVKTQRKEVTSLWRPKPPQQHGQGKIPKITPRNKYIAFLRKLLAKERHDELMAFRTAIGALGLKIEIEIEKSPPTIDGTLTQDTDNQSEGDA